MSGQSVQKDSPNLDLLRSFAVLTVMIDHLVPTMIRHGFVVPTWLSAITVHIGQSGVLAFFVHTSLVLMYSLERMAVHHAGRDLVGRFYVRRAFRIYPLALVCILGVLVLHIPSNTWREPTDVTGRMIVANLLLVQNLWTKESVLGPLWSLPYEVQMYVVLPLLFFWARRPRGVAILATLLLASWVGGLALNVVTHGRMNMAAYAPCFICGVLCYALRDRIPAWFSGKGWKWFVVGSIAAYCVVHIGQPAPVHWIGWIYCLVVCLAINAFRDDIGPLNGPAHKVAMYSYGLYLLHVPVLHLVFNVLGLRSGLVAVPLFFATTFGLSVLAYHLLEGPFMNLGRRLSN